MDSSILRTYNQNMVRKIGIAVLVLASLATGVLWIDSYGRPRFPRWREVFEHASLPSSQPTFDPPETGPYTLEQERHRKYSHITVDSVVFGPDEVAYDHCILLGDRSRLGMFARSGTFWVRLDLEVKKGTPIRRKEVDFHALEYKQRMWKRATGYHYHIREVRFPFFALFVVLFSYPFLVILRSPLRRYRRRKRGMCSKCGYDLTGNVSGVCPECGETV